MVRFKLTSSSLAGLSLGMALGQVIPDPSDVLHFAVFLPYLQTAPESLTKFAVTLFDWYLLPFAWFFAVFLIGLKFGKTNRQRIGLIVGLISAGLLIGLFARYVFTGKWI